MSEQQSFSPAGKALLTGVAMDTAGATMLVSGLVGHFHIVDALNAYRWPLIVFGLAGMLTGTNMMLKAVALMKQQALATDSYRKAKS